MSCVKTTLCVAALMMLISSVQSENCWVKKVSNGIINREKTWTCPSHNKTQESTFCCYDLDENVECCNGFELINNIIQRHMPSLLILLIVVVTLILVCCIICICIPCYCMMRRRPSYKDPSDNANMIAAVSLPNESEEENTPKKEVTHHLPPGAYPVYPQFMGMQPLKSTEVNC